MFFCTNIKKKADGKENENFGSKIQKQKMKIGNKNKSKETVSYHFFTIMSLT